MTSHKHTCRGCGNIDNGPFANCKCNQEETMSENPSNIIGGPGHDAGQSEPVNDPGAFEKSTEDTPQCAANDNPQPSPNPAEEVALGVHVMMLGNGNFAMQVTGEANLGEMYMLLTRAAASVNARIISETIQADQAEAAKVSRIITPGRA